MKPHGTHLGLTSLLIAVLLTVPVKMANAEEQKLKERTEIAPNYLWATETIYASDEGWQADYATVEQEIGKFEALKGTLAKGADALLTAIQLRERTSELLEKAYVYAHLLADQDTRVGKYQAMLQRMQTLAAKFGQATSWMDPELTTIEWATIQAWMDANAELAVYRQAFDDLFRQKKFILSSREEELIALGAQGRMAPQNAYSLLKNADIQFPTIKDENGNDVELSDSAFYIFMRNPDRHVRKAAYEGIVGTYKNYRNTAAALLNGNVQNHIFNVKARGYDSCLAQALDGSNIPVAVYNNLVSTVNDNLHLLHRYQSLRRKTLKLTDGVHAYDLFAPLTENVELAYSYEEAADLMVNALAPLGDEYHQIMTKGVESRWIDVYPTKGKRSGAYSSGSYLTQPYILLNFYGGYEDVSTLAHEMGHSMHSFLTRHNQPYVYGDYVTFCAEVASTANEVLLQDYMLKQITDPQKKLYLLTEFLEGFRGTVFRQTMFSEFEQRIHEMAEQGQPLTADSLGATYGEIMKKYYGPDYTHDELVDCYWIRIPHFYYNFYVYKYATSYCASANIIGRILAGEPGAVDAYLAFLKGGSSQYPIDLLKMARVDMTSPKPIEDAMKYFEMLLDDTEKLLAAQQQ